MNNLRVLIIDDMPTMREALSTLLKNIGFKIIDKAVDGNDAYTKVCAAHVEEIPYGLIFCDIVMPNMNGIDFIRKIFADENFKSIPVIMVSTENEYGVVIDAISAGAKDYIIKPYNQEIVLKKLKKVFK